MQRYNNFSNPPNIRRSFFFESIVRASYTLYIGAPKHHSIHQKTCSPLKDLQTPPKTRSFELRAQRYNDFLKPPNFQQTFFAESHSSQTRHTKARRLTHYRTRRKERSRTADGISTIKAHPYLVRVNYIVAQVDKYYAHFQD